MNSREYNITSLLDTEYLDYIPSEAVNKAAKFGIKVHSELEKICNRYIEKREWMTDEIDVRYRFLCTKVVAILKAERIRPLRAEMQVAYVDDETGKKFRGKIDFLGRNEKNENILIDFKTCDLNEDVLKNVAYQLGMYGFILKQVAKEKRKEFIVKHYLVINVKKKGLPKVVELEVPTDDELLEFMRYVEVRNEEI